MMNYGLREADAVTAGAFLRECMRLDPSEQLSARQLVEHPWLKNAAANVCGG